MRTSLKKLCPNNERSPIEGVYTRVYSLSVPCGDRGQKKKQKTKGLHRGILKTGVLHKEFCAQSLWENLKCGNKRKNNRSLHRDAFLRMCVGIFVYICVYLVQLNCDFILATGSIVTIHYTRYTSPYHIMC